MMAKRTAFVLGLGLFLMTLVCHGCCKNDDEDWSLGCYKQKNTSNWIFDITAGDYDPLVNMTGDDCVRACADVNIGVKFAGLTANGVCLCSEDSDEAISSYKVQNTSCSYPLSDGVYLKVYPVAENASLDAKSPVNALEPFAVKIISSADSNCKYTLDFDDGLKKTFPKGPLTTSHYYSSPGKYKITLSSHVRCLPREVTKMVSVQSDEFDDVSLNCPELVETTEEASCNITVGRGSGLNVTDKNAQFISTMPDTVMQSIGSAPVDYPNMVMSFSNGTFVLPFVSAFHDGFVTGVSMDIVSIGNITVQILSPVCSADKKPCQGGCIPSRERCNLSRIDINVAGDCSGSQAILSTESDNSTNYTVRAQFTFNSTEVSKPYRLPPSKQIPIQRGDVIAFNVPADAIAEMSNHTTSYVLHYCNQSFEANSIVAVSNGEKLQNIQFRFRVHVMIPSFLDIPILDPEPPSISLEYNVSSSAAMELNVKKVVEVQEKISGLQILAPKTGDEKLYATNESILFSFRVTNGTNVNFTVDFGDGSEPQNTTLNNLTHTYQARGNYTFNVIARNRVSTENKTSVVVLVVDIRNLAFVKDPKDRPGRVGEPYEISFSLEAGDRPIFQIDFGNNKTLFSSCNSFMNHTITRRNMSYTEPGIYTVTIYAYGLVTVNGNISSTVTIMAPVEKLAVFHVIDDVPQPIKNNSIELPAVQRFTLLANVSSGWPVFYKFNESGPAGVKSSHSYNPSDFTPTRAGRWLINVTAFNYISNVSTSIRVEIKGGCELGFELHDKRLKSQPFRTIQSMDIRFNTRKKSSTPSSPPSSPNETCEEAPKYFCWKFNWTLLDAESNKPPPGVNYVRNETFFFIGKRILSPGLYKVKMSAVCNVTGNTGSDETYFIIEAAEPVAVILGGSAREVVKPEDGLIVLDASTSYNPDVKNFNSSGLDFTWSCVSDNAKKVALVNNSESKVTINVTLLSVNSTFEIMVSVSSSTKTGIKTGNATQNITLVDDKVPTTEIICRVNCLPFVIPTDRLSLESRLCFPNEDKRCKNVAFVWKLYENGTAEVGDLVSRTNTGVDKPNFVVKADKLKRNTKYKVTLTTNLKNTDISSHSSYLFQTSGELTGGQCQIKPKNGTSAETEFHVECSGWEATHVPLTYKVRYKSPVHKEGERILWYHGQEQVSSVSKLPAGRKNNDFNISVVVEIEGRYGEYTTKNLTVEVKPRQVGREELSKDVDKLTQVDAKKEPQKLVREVVTLATVVNTANTTDSGGANDAQIRSKLVKQLSRVDATTLPLIQQTAYALKSATYDSTQVTTDTQKTAAEALEKMSQNLLKIASDPGTKKGEEIDEVAKAQFSTLSKVLKSSIFTGQDTSKQDAPKEVIPNLYGTLSKKGSQLDKIGKETGEVVRKLDQTIELISAAMARNKLVGENSTVIAASNFNVTLDKSWKRGKEDRIQQKANRSSDSASISLPRRELLLSIGNHRGEIFTEMIAFEKNPYTWDIETAHYIQPDVFSFTFRDENGKKLPVGNLTEEIEITLPNRKSGIGHKTLNDSAEGNFLSYNFHVDESLYDEHILIDIRSIYNTDNLSQGTFYLKFGEKVSQTNFDFKHSLEKNCTNCSRHPIDIQSSAQAKTVLIKNRKKLKCANGEVSVGVLPCSSHKNTECDIKNHTYEIFTQTVSCRYWNHSKWIKDGCRVGFKSTSERTSCLCNHLTAFSSYIVKPNPLNKFSAEDFRQGYVSFVAVVFIFIVYLILLVWARRTDRDDCTKVGVCPLSDNRPQDRYRYEIAVWTGMRRNAGTKSEVTIILSGDKQDTEPRCLMNSNNNGFARGTLEKFLLTTSQDIGSLYCIRVWHDNSQGSWYLSRIMVTDLLKGERYYFICDRWLAVDEDDGMVERLLPVASDEELTDFHHLFYSRTKRGLSDTHLWVSVLNRPPQSLFTRAQRLSCCLCVVMTTMFANAMFYGTKSEPKPDSTNFIGSYSFTWDEVYIGVVSSLIIVPVNMVILYIFRNVRPKSRQVRCKSKISSEPIGLSYHKIYHSQTSLETPEASSDRVTRGSIPVDTANIYSRVPTAEVKRRKQEKLSMWVKFKRVVLPSSLPHWFVYLGWIILALVTLGSATVVVLYGMQFGNGRSLQWLFSIVVSICEDIFVLQPLKVLALALGFALLVKKPDEGEFELSLGDYEDESLQQGSITGPEGEIPEKKLRSSPRIPVRPDEEQLAVMRKARMKQRKMFFLIQEIIVHLIFTVIIMLVTYGHKDTRSIYQFRHMDELSSMTKKVNNFTTFWNWSRHVLIPKAFPETVYNGDDVPRYGFFDDGYNNLISKARMRLLRVKNDSCKMANEFKDTIDVCLKDYSLFDQDEDCYGQCWDSTKKGEKNTAWCFQNWRKLDGFPFWGKFHTYSGSGYINELVPGKDNNKTANNLESLGWLNERARALFVELTTYNANVNLYTSITLLFEFPEFGGVFYFRNIIPMRLKLYVGGFAFFIFACEMVFLLFIAGYLYIAAKKVYRNKMAYFKNFWNLIDFGILVTSLVAIGVHVYRITLTTTLMTRVKDRKGEFVNFQFVTYWSEVLSYIMAIVVALTTLKMTKLMRFNLRISLFGKTLQDAKTALAMFSIQFGIVFFAYVMVGVLVFGYDVANFKSILSAMLSLGRVILGKSQFRALFSSDPIIGPLFFFTYVMFVCWILITMFVAILIDSYHEVQDRCYGMSNEYEIIDFLLARLQAWSGIGGKKKKKIPADRRWRQAGLKMKAAVGLGRKRSYRPSEENIAFEKTGDLMEKLEDSVNSLEKRVQHLSLHFE